MTVRATGRRWRGIEAEHEAAVDDYVALAMSLTDQAWRRAPGPDAWTPAAVTLHLCQSYEMGRAAAEEGATMRLRVPAPMAWVLGRFYLPVILARGRFPRGAIAPVEVRPAADAAGALTIPEGVARLRASAAAAATALMDAPRSLRVRHAYFGALSPATALRLLSAHTRHHTRLLREPAAR